MNKKPYVSIETYNKIMSLPDDKREAVMACYEALGCDVEYLDEVDPEHSDFYMVSESFKCETNICLSFLWAKSKNPEKWQLAHDELTNASIQRNA